ncbi:MAG TPA: hypothetical protein VHS59_01955, partial [Bacillota bacterium]|nr:hypothetical protein [Bacillota bacterium]
YFQDAKTEERQRLQMNYPAKFDGVKWRYQDSGFSLFLNLADSEGPIISNFVNIASNRGISWGDTLVLPGGNRKLELKFFPDFQEIGNNLYSSKSRFPNKPVVQVTVLEQDKKIGSALIPLGKSETAGNLRVGFSDFRYWVLLGVNVDPGQLLISLGGLMTVGGLAWRLLLLTKQVLCKTEESGAGGTKLSWGTRGTYRGAILSEEIRRIISSLEEEEIDNI